MAALSSGNHRQYIDNPTSLADQSAVTVHEAAVSGVIVSMIRSFNQ